MDIHLSVLTPYICCSIIQIGKTPPGKKGRMIKVIILKKNVQFIPTHTKIINIWSSIVCISPPKWWVSIIDRHVIVGFQIITFWNMKLFFNNGNIAKGYMITISIDVTFTLFVYNITLSIYTSHIKPGW